jgi:hypothetical protein
MSNQKFSANRKKLNALHSYKQLTLWSKFFFDKMGCFWMWSGLVNWALRYRGIKKRFGRQMIYRQYSRVFRDEFVASTDIVPSKRVLFFFAMGSESTYNARNLLLAKFYESKGWKSHFMICDGVFAICHKERIGKTREESKSLCYECIYGYDRVSSETGMLYNRLSNYLPIIEARLPDLYNRIDNNLSSISDCLDYLFDSYKVGQCVKASVLRFHYTGSIDKCDIKVFKRHLKEGVKCVLLFEEFFRAEHQNLVVLWNGAGFMDRLCSEVCRRLEVPFVTQESFWGAASWIYKINGIAIHLDYRKEYKKYGSLELLSDSANKQLDELLASFRGKNLKMTGIDIREQLGLLPSDEYIALFTNMNFDTYVLGRDTIFESMTDWLISTVKFINQINSKVKLVVRAHPGELSFVTPTRDFVRDSIVSVMHDKVVFVDADSSINSYDILDGASSVLVYSSTIGVEAILDGKTTVCAGSTFYDDFVLKPESKEKYFEVVEALTNHSLRLEINIIDLRKYLYYLYFERILALEGIGIHRSTGEDFIDTSYSAESLINMNRSVLERFYNEVSDEVAL